MNTEYITEKIKEHDNKLSIHDDKINELDKKQIESHILMQNMLDSQKELSGSIKEFSKTMIDVEKTMVSIQNSLEDNRKDVQELKNDIVSVNNRMDGFNSAFNQDVEKNKIDLRDVSKEEGKKNLGKMFAYGGVATGVIAILGVLIKVMETLQQFSSVIHK